MPLPPVLSCPAWSDDRDEHIAPSWLGGAKVVVRTACVQATADTPSVSEIEEWHKGLFSDAVPLDCYAGNTRQVNSVHPCLAQDVAVQVPTSSGVLLLNGEPFQTTRAKLLALADETVRGMAALAVRWPDLSHQARAQQTATIIGLAVGMFIKIHPFLNGNGRISRLLWRVLLARLRFPPHVSVVRRPAAPYGTTMQAAMVGDYRPAIMTVFAGIASAPMVRAVP